MGRNGSRVIFLPSNRRKCRRDGQSAGVNPMATGLFDPSKGLETTQAVKDFLFGLLQTTLVLVKTSKILT